MYANVQLDTSDAPEVLGNDERSMAAYLASFRRVDSIHPYAFRNGGEPLSDADMRETRRSLMDQSVTTLAYRDHNGRVEAAVSCIEIGRGTVAIANLFRLPESRRGAGRELLGHALAWTLAQGYEQAELSVMPANTHARKLYQAIGFTLLRRSFGDSEPETLRLQGASAIRSAIEQLIPR